MGLIPTRYPGSERHEDSKIRLARRTEWEELAPNAHVGIGQRLWSTDADEYSLLDVRTVSFDPPQAATQ